MVFTIEPMINAGKKEVYQDADNGWTIYTPRWYIVKHSGEYTVAITEDGIEILTK